MRNYNEEFFKWLQKLRDIDPKTHEDVPEDLQNEFEKLMFLADIPFRHIYGEDPEAMSEFLLICLTEEDYYDENHRPLKIKMMEEGKVFTSPITHKVAQPVLFAEDNRGRYFAFLYCDWRGPDISELAAILDDIPEGAELFIILLTDYDLARSGQKINRIDPDPKENDPSASKLHIIFFNAAMVG